MRNVANNICLILPCFNVEKHLIKLVERVSKHIDSSQIIAVNDGSKDNTSKIIKELGLFCIEFSENRGKGVALKAGIDFAIELKREWVITMDSDLQHSPESLPDFINKAETKDFDLIIGSRNREDGNMPLDRQFSNWSTSLLLSVLTSVHIKDAQSGYRMFKTELVRGLNFTTKKYDFEAEFLLKMIRKGARVTSVEIPTIYSGTESSISRLPDTFRFLSVVAKHFLWDRK